MSELLHRSWDATTDCYIHHINGVTGGANLRYGFWIAAASQNIAIDGCRFAQCRHGVTFGTNSDTNGNGIQRCVTVSNCVSMQTDTSHYDTHEPCDGVSFVNCPRSAACRLAGPMQLSGSVTGEKRHNLRLCDQGHSRTWNHALQGRIKGGNRHR
jgi:hypothetical protein